MSKKISIPRHRESLTLTAFCSFGTIPGLIYLDIWGLNASQRSDLMSVVYLIGINFLVIGVFGLTNYLIIPDFLLTYTEEGIRWPSLRGYRLMRWSEINVATLSVTFWGGTRIILVSPDKKIGINAQLFANSNEAIAEIRKHVPEEKWT